MLAPAGTGAGHSHRLWIAVTPYVVVQNAAAFLDFLHEAFDAVERGRVVLEDGTIGHAEVWIGNRVLLDVRLQTRLARHAIFSQSLR